MAFRSTSGGPLPSHLDLPEYPGLRQLDLTFTVKLKDGEESDDHLHAFVTTVDQISSIRGVDCDGVVRALVDRGLVAEVGRDEGPGRPILYGTTSLFLERLALPSLADLPPILPLLRDAEAEETAVSAE